MAKGAGIGMRPLKGPIPDSLYVMLEVTPEQVAAAPQISHILKKSNVLDELIDFLRGSVEPIAKAFLSRYDSLSAQHQKIAPVEAICVSAGVETGKFIGVVMEAVFAQTRLASELMAAAAQPDVVQATLEAALVAGRDGVADRKMIHQHSGFLPIPKTQIVSMPGARIDARTQTAQTVVLPQVESDVKKMSDRFNRVLEENRKLLPAPAEFEDVDD